MRIGVNWGLGDKISMKLKMVKSILLSFGDGSMYSDIPRGIGGPGVTAPRSGREGHQGLTRPKGKVAAKVRVDPPLEPDQESEPVPFRTLPTYISK